jgi:hypothetical protein
MDFYFNRWQFSSLLQYDEDGLKNFLDNKFLPNYYDKEHLIIDKNYTIAVGDLPVGLVAHLDIAVPVPAREDIHYDKTANIIYGNNGLGADDRAGVFGIMTLLKKTKYRPTVIFTLGEEKGGEGVYDLVQKYPKPPTELNFLIELDREGAMDAVYYRCNNQEFEYYIESFGFIENFGTFSDISIVAPKWDIAAVNLSIGYYYEHTDNEIFYIGVWQRTLKLVNEILASQLKEPKKFEYGQLVGCCDFCKRNISPFTIGSPKLRTISIQDLDGDFYTATVCETCYEAFTNKLGEHI